MDSKRPRQQIGPYTLVEVLGRGGMGVVYRAEQTEPIHRQVAVKVIKLGMDTAQVVARFEAERQALARMDHPGIARIYDGGATPEGRPYFVMELVQGEDITNHCDRHRLDLEARLRLFVDVCRAVQHAHQKGIIHRDLKPSNILVVEGDGGPVPKIIDFGIARATGEAGGDESTRLTQVGQAVGTPAYMAPEQVDGPAGAVDTRVDVYALGAVLYELLTGVPPVDLEGLTPMAVWGHIVEGRRQLPSQRVRQGGTSVEMARRRGLSSTEALARGLRGDLDWIVGRATDNDPERRYETANGLAMDVERHLALEPVVARPPSTWYRATRFVRRNAAGVAVAVAFVLLLAGFGLNQAIQAERIRAARDLAEARRQQAESTLDFMLSDLRTKLEPLGRLELLDDVGRQAMVYFSTLPEEEFTDDELQSRSQALYQIGSVRMRQGEFPAADSAFQASLRLATALHERDPDHDERLFGVGQAEFWVGYLAFRRGLSDQALRHFERYRELSEQLSARDPGKVEWLLEVGYGHTNVGAVLREKGELDRASEALRASLEVKRRVVELTGDPDRIYDLARGWFNLALTERDLGRLEESVASLERDLALKNSLLADRPDNTVWLTTTADSEVTLGSVLFQLGRPEAALERFQRGGTISRQLVRRDASDADVSRRVAISSGWEARALAALGRTEKAVSLQREVPPILERLSRNNPEDPGLVEDLAGQEIVLAELLLERARPSEAVERLRGALARIDSLVPDAPASPTSLGMRAEAFLQLGRAEAALGSMMRAREFWTRALTVVRDIQVEGASPARLDQFTSALLLLERHEEAAPAMARLRGMGYAEPGWTAIVAEAGR